MEMSGQPALPREGDPQEIGWAPESIRRCGEDEFLLPLPQIEPRFLCYPAQSLVTMPTELSVSYSLKKNRVQNL
jgi:hypothetical protein